MTENSLRVDGVGVEISGFRAIDEVSLEVKKLRRAALIGPNGAGKSTFLKAITGEQRICSGEITYNGRTLGRTPAFQRARHGIVRTRQELGLFWSMTVSENIAFGADNPRSSRTRGRPVASSIAEQMIALLGLEHWRDHVPEELPYGVRKRVELARALATRPSLILLDEPVAGLNSHEKAEMVALLDRVLSELEVTLIIVEHDMETISQLCPEDVYALVAGRLVAHGSFDEVIRNSEVVAAYLGNS